MSSTWSFFTLAVAWGCFNHNRLLGATPSVLGFHFLTSYISLCTHLLGCSFEWEAYFPLCLYPPSCFLSPYHDQNKIQTLHFWVTWSRLPYQSFWFSNLSVHLMIFSNVWLTHWFPGPLLQCFSINTPFCSHSPSCRFQRYRSRWCQCNTKLPRLMGDSYRTGAKMEGWSLHTVSIRRRDTVTQPLHRGQEHTLRK